MNHIVFNQFEPIVAKTYQLLQIVITWFIADIPKPIASFYDLDKNNAYRSLSKNTCKNFENKL